MFQVQANRLAELQQEAGRQRLAALATRHVNLWARLLPRLRRLERWLERHAGQDAGMEHTAAVHR